MGEWRVSHVESPHCMGWERATKFCTVIKQDERKIFPGSTAPRALAKYFCDANVDARDMLAVAVECRACGNTRKQTVRENEQPRRSPLFGQSVDLSDLELCHKLAERRHYCQRQHQQHGFVARLLLTYLLYS